mgnify:CR=1 FL=1
MTLDKSYSSLVFRTTRKRRSLLNHFYCHDSYHGYAFVAPSDKVVFLKGTNTEMVFPNDSDSTLCLTNLSWPGTTDDSRYVFVCRCGSAFVEV